MSLNKVVLKDKSMYSTNFMVRKIHNIIKMYKLIGMFWDLRVRDKNMEMYIIIIIPILIF